MIDLLRRNMMAEKGGGLSLPAEYQQVEWIAPSVKGAYIDTGVICTENTGVAMDVLGKTKVVPAHLFATTIRTTYGIGMMIYASGVNDIMYYWSNTGQTLKNSPPYYNCDILTKYSYNFYNNRKIKYGEDVAVDNVTPDNTNSTIPLFVWKPLNRYGDFKLYKAELTEGNDKVRELIPCYRKSDNVAGMYDIVNNVFYTNAGTGEFIVGADVN